MTRSPVRRALFILFVAGAFTAIFLMLAPS
jgi:hypothetical protein